MLNHFFPFWLVVIFGLVATVIFSTGSFWRMGMHTVVVYAAQDREYAEPILNRFERGTGIKVKAIYDSEAVKTVGLANRLLAERARPQCDVFWGNEELRTRQLAAQNVFRERRGWDLFGHRSRRIVINTNLVSAVSAPRSLIELTNATWRGKIAVAYPLFGTTATHFLALRQHWGESNWLVWCRALQANQPRILDGNSMVVRQVGRGEAAIGLTDSDDIAAGQREGLPVAALPLTPESLLIPNSIALIRGAPHGQAAQHLFTHLQTTGVAWRLVASNALESATLDTDASPTLRPDWEGLLRDLDKGTAQLQEIFRR
jgi:iron(III) transport system substrate-binding protein